MLHKIEVFVWLSVEFDEFKWLILSNSIKAIFLNEKTWTARWEEVKLLLSRKNTIKQFFSRSKKRKISEWKEKNRVENFYVFKKENLFISQMFWRAWKITFAFAKETSARPTFSLHIGVQATKSALKKSFSRKKEEIFMILALRLSSCSKNIFLRFSRAFDELKWLKFVCVLDSD